MTIESLAINYRSSHCRNSFQSQARAELGIHLLTSKGRSDLGNFEARWADCAESVGCDHQKFPRLQVRVYNSQSRCSSYDPEGIHLKSLKQEILVFVVRQMSAKLEDQSQPYDPRKCKQPLVNEHVHGFYTQGIGFRLRQRREGSLTFSSHRSSPALVCLVATGPGKASLV